MKQKELGDRLVARNRRAHFDYELGDTYEAGLVLRGSEVRSLRENGADLTDAWVDVRQGEAIVRGLHIHALKHAAEGHEEKAPRKLLLHREQIENLRAASDRDGRTVVVTRLYFTRGRAKLELAVGKGKAKHDKRQALRERDAVKEARQAMRRAQGKREA